MFEDFTTLAYMISFPGMILTVILLTQFTKTMFDNVLKVATKYLVFFYSAALCVVAAIVNGTFVGMPEVLGTILVWTVNSVIVWLAAMKAYETVSASLMSPNK